MKKLQSYMDFNNDFLKSQNKHTHTHRNIEVWRHSRSLYYNVILILVLMMSTNIGINGQAPDPCNCISWIQRGTTGGTTVINSMTPPVADCTWFRGTVLITGSVFWSNLSIRMAAGSSIVVESTLNINNCYIGTCDTLWRGISGGDIGLNFITVTNSVISGANIAIELTDVSVYDIEYNQFINNYVGISTGNPFEAIPTDIAVSSGDVVIRGCDFYTDTQLPHPYVGHHYYPSWPAIASIQYNQGYAAMYIAGSTGLSIGALEADHGDRNRIYQMRNGIIITSASSSVMGTDFFDFEGSVPKVAALSGHLNYNQRGISLENGFCHIEQNSFDNVMIGVHSGWSSQVIVDNIMDIPIQAPVAATRGIDIIRPITTYIADNIIYNGFKGISVAGSTIGLTIQDNELFRELTIHNNVGIDLVQLYGVSLNNRVRNNEIEITGGQRAVGISMNQVYELYLFHNTIDFLQTEPLPAGRENAGISGMQVYNSLISENIITASSHYKSRVDNAGIVMTNCMGNDLFCNETYNMYYGQWIIGSNMETDLKSNEFYDAFHGLDLFSPVRLGPQEHFGNKWLGSYTAFGAFISGLDPVNTALESQFIADESDASPGVLIPALIGPTAIEDDWFEDQDGITGGALCTEYPPPTPLTDTLVSIVRNAFVFTDYEDEMNWMRKADMLTFLYLYPALLSNTVLDSFFDAEVTTPLGELMWAQYHMGLSHGLDTGMAAKDTKVFDYISQVRVLDSLIGLNPSNIVALKALRELKIDTLAGHREDWLVMLDSMVANIEVAIDDALDVVDNVTPSNRQETDLQAMLLLKGGHTKGDSLTTSELEGVYELARQCPWIGARSLSEAQILYSQIADSIFTHRPGECVELDPFMEGRSDGGDYTHEIQIYPNPATDLIFMQLPEWAQTIVIHSLDGRQWKQLNTPDGGHHTIGINDIPSGIYAIRVQGGKKVETQQITITR